MTLTYTSMNITNFFLEQFLLPLSPKYIFNTVTSLHDLCLTPADLQYICLENSKIYN